MARAIVDSSVVGHNKSKGHEWTSLTDGGLRLARNIRFKGVHKNFCFEPKFWTFGMGNQTERRWQNETAKVSMF